MSDESIEFLTPGGRIVVHFDDVAVPLRRPKLGELKRFRLSIVDVADDARRLREQHVRALDDVAEDERPEWIAARNREREAASEAAIIGWWRDVFAALAPSGVVPADADEWPPFLTMGVGIVDRCIEHWRSYP